MLPPLSLLGVPLKILAVPPTVPHLGVFSSPSLTHTLKAAFTLGEKKAAMLAQFTTPPPPPVPTPPYNPSSPAQQPFSLLLSHRPTCCSSFSAKNRLGDCQCDLNTLSLCNAGSGSAVPFGSSVFLFWSIPTLLLLPLLFLP